MKNKELEKIKERLSPEQYVALYITERLANTLDKFTDVTSTMFTNPFGMGDYMKLLPGKENPISYLLPVNFLGAVTYFVSARYGTDMAGYISLSFTFIIDILLVWAHYNEKASKRKKE